MGFKAKEGYYFGRTLDVCATLGENVVIAPRNFKLKFAKCKPLEKHYAIIGMAHVAEGFPLYYDGMNEKGLCMAGLNFPDNAVYHEPREGKTNIAPFELIPYILGSCASVAEAKNALKNVHVCDISFSKDMPHTPLHWIIGDLSGEIVVESVASGLHVFENPAGVLTNNPPFETQFFNLKNYARLSAHDPENTFGKGIDLSPYSRGLGALGLPGDWSSPSRFVRAAFIKFRYAENVQWGGETDFFHMLDGVSVPKGCVDGDAGFQYTVYACCCDAARLTYSFTTYENREIVTVALENLDKSALSIR